MVNGVKTIMVNGQLRPARVSHRTRGRAKRDPRRKPPRPPPSGSNMANSKPLVAKSSFADANAAVQSALRTLDAGISGVGALAAALQGPLGPAFAETVDLIREANGRVIVTGLGKSGHVARKIAATLASTGTPAFFVHAPQPGHGELGMLTAGRGPLRPRRAREHPGRNNLTHYSAPCAIR